MADRDHSIRARISGAIHAEKLSEVAEALTAESVALTADDARLVEAARRVCARIREQLVGEANSLASRLREAAIPCEFDAANPDLRAPQYHRFSLSLEVDDPTRAVELLKELGYWHPLSAGSMYWESFRRNHTEMTLTCIDDASTRLDLRWRGQPATAPWRPGIGFLLRHPAKVTRAAWRRIGRLAARRATPDTRFLGDLLSTPRSLLPQLLSFGNVTSDDVLVDIGCGDGRVLIEAARRTGCHGIGLENQRDLCNIATDTVRRERLEDRVNIRHGDACTAPLTEATVVFLFIPVRALRAYLPDLLGRLASGSRVVAHEQVALECTPEPDCSSPLIGDDAVTVAHLWRV